MITARGLARLQQQLKDLQEELVRTFDERQKAAAEGDLRENSAYIFLGERANVLKTQIDDIESELKVVKVTPTPTTTTQIQFGHQVTVLFKNDNRELTFFLVGRSDTGIESNWISIESPLGIAVVGKKIGDTVDVNGQPVIIKSISIASL